MALIPFNSVGGYSTGITGTTVIDANGNITGVGATFSGLARFNAGISASGGITFNSNVTINSANTLNVSTIVGESGKTQLDIDNKAAARVAIGDYSAAGNGTSIFLRDNVSGFQINNPYGDIDIGDPNALDTGAYITYRANEQTLYGNGSNLTDFASITITDNLYLQNLEYIRNTTNGRIDFMPFPGGSTHYGLYVDTTSWGYGPALGTIRSSDGALNTAQIRWDVALVVGNDVNFSLGSNQQNVFRVSTTGNDTVQFVTNVTTGTNSGALALVDANGAGNANRSPGVTHSNPNLYVYRAGTASANDFIRIEHDGTGRIVSGGSTNISIQPGGGVLEFIGGMSGDGITLSGNLSAATKSFVIPHPTKPGKTLQYGSLEGPENGVYVRGKIEGSNVINLPDYWTGLVNEDSITVQLTEYGYKDCHWVESVIDNKVIIQSESQNIHCYYNVYGERKDVAKLTVEY